MTKNSVRLAVVRVNGLILPYKDIKERITVFVYMISDKKHVIFYWVSGKGFKMW